MMVYKGLVPLKLIKAVVSAQFFHLNEYQIEVENGYFYSFSCKSFKKVISKVPKMMDNRY